MMGNVAGVTQLLETAGTPVPAMPNGTSTPHTDDFAAAMQQANADAGHIAAPSAEVKSPEPPSAEAAETSPQVAPANHVASMSTATPKRPGLQNSTAFTNGNMLMASLAKSTSTVNAAPLPISLPSPATSHSPAAAPVPATSSASAPILNAASVTNAAPAATQEQPLATLLASKPVAHPVESSDTASPSSRSSHPTGKPAETVQTLAVIPSIQPAPQPQPVLNVSDVPVAPVAIAVPPVPVATPSEPVESTFASSVPALHLQAPTTNRALAGTPTLPLVAAATVPGTPRPLTVSPPISNQGSETILSSTIPPQGTAKAASAPSSLSLQANPAASLASANLPASSASTPSTQPAIGTTAQSELQGSVDSAAGAIDQAVNTVSPNTLIASASAAPPAITSTLARPPLKAASTPSASAASSSQAGIPSAAASAQPVSAAQPVPAPAPRTATVQAPAPALKTAILADRVTTAKPSATDLASPAAIPSATSAASSSTIPTPAPATPDNKAHLVAVQPVASPVIAAPSTTVDPSALPLAIPAVHAPIAFSSLSTPASIGEGAILSTSTTASAGDTIPHSTLSSSPTSLEVGVSSGTHGWLKIRAELNASGTVDASLTGTTTTAANKLQSDLPALNSFLQNEKVSVGALSVTAPSAAAATLHTATTSTLDSTAFTRAATEAATGSSLSANVGTDAGATGGRAPQQNPQSSGNQAAVPVDLRTGLGVDPHVDPHVDPRESSDLPVVPEAVAASYGDLTELGGRTAASAVYPAGGSWLNVRV